MAMIEDYLAFLDTETGGLTPGKDPVIEVACILTKLDMSEVGRFEAKIQLRPGETVNPKAAEINGYHPDIWEREAVPFEGFKTFLKRNIPYGHVAIPAGHNVGFDMDMIRDGYYKPTHEFCPISYRKIDTIAIAMAMKIAGVIEVPNVKLTTVSKALGIAHEKAHSAMSDTLVVKELFSRAVNVFRRIAAQA